MLAIVQFIDKFIDPDDLLINLLINLLIKVYLFYGREFYRMCSASHAKLFFKGNIVFDPFWIIFRRMKMCNQTPGSSVWLNYYLLVIM